MCVLGECDAARDPGMGDRHVDLARGNVPRDSMTAHLDVDLAAHVFLQGVGPAAPH